MAAGIRVTKLVGEPLVLSDPVTGQVGIYTTALQSTDTQTFISIRLAVRNGQIVEIEHVLSTKRNLSAPPTPIGDVNTFKRDPDFAREVPASPACFARHSCEACQWLLRHAAVQQRRNPR